MMRDEFRLLSRLRQDESGNVFPLTAAAVFVLAGLVGGGVDMSRAYQAQNRLQNACDAAVLAGRKAVTTNGFDAAAVNSANSYFNINFSGVTDVENANFAPSSPDNGNTISATASGTINTVVMNLFGYESMPISVSCTASMSMGNADVVMVLDTTGSMDWAISGSDSTRRIDALETAMKNFYDSLATTTAGTNARVRYGFVPYNQSVNVGYLLDPSWLVDSMQIQSREAQYIDVERDTDEIERYENPQYRFDQSTGNSSFTSWTDLRGSWRKARDCEDEEPNDTNWATTGPTETSETFIDGSGNRVTEVVRTYDQTRTEYQCYRKSKNNYWIESRTQSREYYFTITATEEPVYKKEIVKVFDDYLYKRVLYDTSEYKTGAAVTTVTGDDGADQTSTWAGCIEERDTVSSGSISYSTFGGFSPSGLHDLDIDSVPTSDATRWRPMWPEVAYVRTNRDRNRLVSSSETEHGVFVGASCPIAAQLLQSMDQDAFYDYAESLSPRGGTYHSIGMIWGARLSSPQGIFGTNVNEQASNGGEVSRHIIFMTDGEMDTNYAQSAWGVEWHDRRVTDNGYSNQDNRHNDRLLAVCAAAKAKGIRIWVIALSTSLTATLTNCASTDSSFTASSSDQLNEAFQEIAKNVGELRITQ